MKYYKIKIKGHSSYVTKESDLCAILEDLREMEVGTQMTITIIDMSDEDYENLPEYEGP